MRILHVGKFYPPVAGGMERMLQLLCESERPAVDSRVLVVGRRLQTIQETCRGVPVTRVGRLGTIGSVGLCPTFPIWLRRLAGDVNVIHEPNPLALVSTVLARPRGHLVVWFHSEVVRPRWKYHVMYRPFLRAVLSRAERIVASSPKLIEHAVELQDFRTKCASIPFGVDVKRFEPTPAVISRVEAIRRERPGPLVLFVGRLVPYKGLNVLLQALAGLQGRAVLVGDGPGRPDLERLARTLHLDGQVTFAGEVSEIDLVALYHACDVFVLPSVTRAEAFGVVQLEAMACGKPVVSTDLPSGVPWVNQHGQTGLVVQPGSVTALREALGRLLEDTALRGELGRRGRERIDREFTVRRMVGLTAAMYRECAGD
jgi:rhamnosyl/mannosyltransferase